VLEMTPDGKVLLNGNDISGLIPKQKNHGIAK
jgi:hypothetical protein